MIDTEIDRRVRDYFAARANKHSAPDFESMLAGATARRRGRHLPWMVPAIVATLLIAIALRTDREGGDAQAAAELVAELSKSTHWTAPSDRWLGRQMPMQLHTLPDFDWMTTPIEEANVWL